MRSLTRPTAARLPRFRRFVRLVPLVVLGALVIVAPLLAATLLRGPTLAASAAAGLAVARIEIEGRQRTPMPALIASLKVTRGMPILGVALDDARQRLERLPWVARASVGRRLPDTVLVELTERQPLAIWQHDGAMMVIDQDGQPIVGADVARWGQLPLVVGAGAESHAKALIALMASAPDVAKRVPTAIWVEGRRWNLDFDNGFVAKLPEVGSAEMWSYLVGQIRDHALLERAATGIDLRVPDLITVERPAAPPTPAVSGVAPVKPAKPSSARG